MNPRLTPLLDEYITDSQAYHVEYHKGDFETCDKTCCVYARELARGWVSIETYQAITDGRERVSQ